MTNSNSISVVSVSELLYKLAEGGLLEDSFYRGQKNKDWNLSPTIFREGSGVINGYDDWNVLEYHIIDQFKKYAIPFLDEKPTYEIEWLTLAQHHGLPTRLLDWSTNPLIGLFFALKDQSVDGALWIYDFNSWRQQSDQKLEQIDQYKEITAYLPDHSNKRLVAQDSVFTIFPLTKIDQANLEIDSGSPMRGGNKILKIIIPKHAKSKLMQELKILGINYAKLFPDLNGVSERIKDDLLRIDY